MSGFYHKINTLKQIFIIKCLLSHNYCVTIPRPYVDVGNQIIQAMRLKYPGEKMKKFMFFIHNQKTNAAQQTETEIQAVDNYLE